MVFAKGISGVVTGHLHCMTDCFVAYWGLGNLMTANFKSHCLRKPGGAKRLGSADFLFFFQHLKPS